MKGLAVLCITIPLVLLLVASVVGCQQQAETPPVPSPTPNVNPLSIAGVKAACASEARIIQLGVNACMAENSMESLVAVTIGPGDVDSGTWLITDGTDSGTLGDYLRRDIKGTYNASVTGLVTVMSYPGLTDADLIEINSRLEG